MPPACAILSQFNTIHVRQEARGFHPAHTRGGVAQAEAPCLALLPQYVPSRQVLSCPAVALESVVAITRSLRGAAQNAGA